MNSHISRRDFLRLAGLLPLTFAAPQWTRKLSGVMGQKNVIVIVFDAFSASNISLYGYQRETTPNLARWAERAIVYHNHFAASNFTTSGTASLLTGVLPWSHRALADNGKVAEPFVNRTAFHAFEDYYRIAYTHNPWAFTLLDEFGNEIDDLVAREKLYLKSYDDFVSELFSVDEDIASVSWVRDMKSQDGYAYSLFLSHVDTQLQKMWYAGLGHEYPFGLPCRAIGNYFLLEQAVDWIAHELSVIAQPFFGYFHFLPPHSPYRPPREFMNRFEQDNYRPIEKPVDVFVAQQSDRSTSKSRLRYDEFVLYADREFGRFCDQLERSGLLDNTWVILTSDHGEMFERGIIGHSSDTLYQPLLRIPLMILEPGRQQRLDVHTPTSAVDVVPTLAHVTGHAIPSWTEGIVLPPYASADPDPSRSLYALRATRNDPAAPLTVASTMLVKGRYKMMYYFGYPELAVPELVKLYDIQADPEEMNDLVLVQRDAATALLTELKAKLADVNRPYL